MKMEIQTFEQRSQGTGDTLSASDAENIPLLVKIRELREGVVTKHAPGGTRAILLDVLNLSTQEIKLGIMWFNGAIVDNLLPHVGKAMAIRLVLTSPKKAGGNSYYMPEQLEGADLAAAAAWASQRPTLFEDEYERRGLTLPDGAIGNMNNAPAAQESAPAASAPAAQGPSATPPPAASAPAAATPPPAASAPAAATPPPAASAPAAPAAATPPPPAASAPASAAADDDEPPF